MRGRIVIIYLINRNDIVINLVFKVCYLLWVDRANLCQDNPIKMSYPLKSGD